MMAFLGPKGFSIEVTEGIDLERTLVLTGQRVTVGTGPGDDLRLGARDVVSGHITFERRKDGKGWEFFTSDRGVSEVDRGNPRTGAVRPGMWFRLGRETRIDIRRVAAPVETEAAPSGGAQPKTVPLGVALPAMGLMVLAAVGFVLFAGAGQTGQSGMRTTGWVERSAPIEPAVERCLASAGSQARTISPDDPSSAFWRTVSLRQSDPAAARAAEADLIREVRAILTEAHFLTRENRAADASEALRRMEYVLPVGLTDCPILSASRFDLALLELRGNR
ncbi:hypothetical protein GQ651_17985 [Alphaproteobacteria bacterium GH1-50]|uniref:Uncharacterized protein n=1 Tax=Kangsaoukella pontilimi TaxID=2691042 RepID=A0A7C9MYA7_9RHOB|nr:hypothetical protein [Kangsaoukella pontilimi]MXQ09740.1 hypothetical protein [Kangsaoukella pontilimi]